EPPRLITDFSYRADGLGFRLDRPSHVFVVDVPPLPDPTADVPRADEGSDEPAAPTGAVASTGVAPVQVTTGPLDHGGPTWLDDGELLVLRDVVDTLGAALVRHPATAGSEGVEIGEIGRASWRGRSERG